MILLKKPVKTTDSFIVDQKNFPVKGFIKGKFEFDFFKNRLFWNGNRLA